MPPEQVKTPAPTQQPEMVEPAPFWRRKIVWASLLAIILIGGGIYFFVNSQPAAQITTNPTGWKIYQNQEIGIAFEYPESWGEIFANSTKGECDNLDPREIVSGDPCTMITLSVLYDGENRSAFLAAQTALNHAHPLPRGSFWGDTYIGSPITLSTYCASKTPNTCTLRMNSKGVKYVKDDIAPDFSGTVKAYLMYSSHEHHSVVLTPPLPGTPQEAEFNRLVDSIQFIQPNVGLSDQNASTIEKINWNIEKANPNIVDDNDYRKSEQAIAVDVTFADNRTKRYSLGTAYGCTGSNVESTQDGKRVLGKVNCYFALTGVGFVAYSQNGKFVVERGDESAKDGSVKTTVLLEI